MWKSLDSIYKVLVVVIDPLGRSHIDLYDKTNVVSDSLRVLSLITSHLSHLPPPPGENKKIDAYLDGVMRILSVEELKYLRIFLLKLRESLRKQRLIPSRASRIMPAKVPLQCNLARTPQRNNVIEVTYLYSYSENR